MAASFYHTRTTNSFWDLPGTTSYTLDVATATLSLTAEPIPSFQIAMGMPVAQATLSLTAEPITALSRGINFAVAQASLTLTAEPVNLTYTPFSPPPPPPPPGTYVMDVATATLSLTAEPVGINAALGMDVAPAYMSLTAAGQGTTAITATVVTSFILGNWTNNGGAGDTFVWGFTGTLTVQGRTFQVGDTVLVNRATNLSNGLYVCTADGTGAQTVTFVRDSRMVSAAAIQDTMVTASSFDNTNGGTSWINGVAGPITFGTTRLKFVQTYPVTFGISVSIPVATATLSLTAEPVMLVYSNGTTIPYHAVTVRCIDPGRRVRPPI